MKCLEATDITSGDLRVKNAISSYLMTHYLVPKLWMTLILYTDLTTSISKNTKTHA